MTETHIGVWKAPHAANVWYWQHPGCAWNAESTLAAAADAGRAHLRDNHPDVVWAAGGNVYQAETYCRACGVRHGSTDENHALRSHRCSGEMQNTPPTANRGTP